MVNRVVRKIWRLAGRRIHRRKIFLLSHMRANTSLLGHILGSNPGIEGYYELHESYLEPIDLEKAKDKYYGSHCPKFGAIYLFDKLLHNHHKLSPEMVNEGDRVIFMIREPRATVSSIIKIFATKPGSQWQDQESAERYYIERLKELKRLSDALKNQYFFLKAEDLIQNSESTSASLTTFLGLKSRLSSEYRTFSKTGQRGFGDSSSNINAGVIVKGRCGEGQRIETAPKCHEVYRHTLLMLVENAYKP